MFFLYRSRMVRNDTNQGKSEIDQGYSRSSFGTVTEPSLVKIVPSNTVIDTIFFRCHITTLVDIVTVIHNNSHCKSF